MPVVALGVMDLVAAAADGRHGEAGVGRGQVRLGRSERRRSWTSQSSCWLRYRRGDDTRHRVCSTTATMPARRRPAGYRRTGPCRAGVQEMVAGGARGRRRRLSAKTWRRSRSGSPAVVTLVGHVVPWRVWKVVDPLGRLVEQLRCPAAVTRAGGRLGGDGHARGDGPAAGDQGGETLKRGAPGSVDGARAGGRSRRAARSGHTGRRCRPAVEAAVLHLRSRRSSRW